MREAVHAGRQDEVNTDLEEWFMSASELNGLLLRKVSLVRRPARLLSDSRVYK